MTRANPRTRITPRKILRAGNSVWSGSKGIAINTKSLETSIKVDVAVIGAGMSGAFLAHALAPLYGQVAVFDRREPLRGATFSSTAMLQYEIDEPLIDLSRRIGPKKARRAWQESFQATQDLISLVEGEGIRCGLERRCSLYLAGDQMGGRALQRESEARLRLGLPGEYLDKSLLREKFGIDRQGAILSSKAAIANPVQLAAGLLRRALQQGVTLYSPVDICDVWATSHGVILDTGEHFVEARKAVFCTGYERLKDLPDNATRITSSWAIATQARSHYPDWLNRTLVWEASKPYLYVRTTKDHRLIAGGEDENIDRPTYRSRSLDVKSRRLLSKLKRLGTGIDARVSHKWSGAFGESVNGLPLIDAVPHMPNCFAVMGFGGNGTIYSMIAAQVIPKLLVGRSDENADLYRFHT